MDSPNFYIKDLINKFSELNDFRAELFKKNILSKDYIDENLFLIYNKFDQPSNSQLIKECRSIILDSTTKNIISFSCETPLLNSQALEYLLLNQNVEKIITKCYEGTLLSVFFNNDKWYVSTRRCLNSEESVWGEKSHFKMFMEILEKSGYESFSSFTDKLSKDKCYYFVLIHHQNKNVVEAQVVGTEELTEEVQSVVSIEAVSVPELIDRPRSNFSQEVLVAAETRGLPTAAVVAVGPAINTSMIIDAEMNSEKQVAGRGLLRKISRTLLGEENEESDGKKYVQFAVFQIPVKQ
jgi:hypothetical protein